MFTALVTWFKEGKSFLATTPDLVQKDTFKDTATSATNKVCNIWTVNQDKWNKWMIYCLRNENPLGALLIKFSKDDSSTANCAEFKKKNQQALTDGITIVLGD